MVDLDEIRQSLHGPTAIEQLLATIGTLHATIDTLQHQLIKAQTRIVELEKRLPPPKDQQAYSLDAEEKRQAKMNKPVSHLAS